MQRKSLVPLVLLAGSLGALVWATETFQTRKAWGDLIASYVLYGIQGAGGELIRYDFDSGQMESIGTIQTSEGTTLGGIGAAAYFPGFENIFAFWYDSTNQVTRLVYVNTKTASGTVVGDDLGAGRVTAAAAVWPPNGSGYNVYAVQDTAADPVEFTITADQAVPEETFAAKVTVLGAAISYGGQYDMPVTMKVKIAGQVIEPFGTFTTPVNANMNDAADDEVSNDPGDCPREYVIPSTYGAGNPVTVVGQSWIKKNSNNSGSSNSHWKVAYTADSSANQDRVITLRDGDAAPNIAGFMSQASAKDYVEDYVDFTTNTMKLDANQVIYLFELGSSTTGSAADFQDLVVLVTLGHTVEELGGSVSSGASVSGAVSGSININPNNSPNNEFTLVKPDGGVISRDDLHQNTTVDGSGVYYSGPATSVYVKPKGSGSQNSLLVNGVAVTLENNTGYTITDSGGTGMTVTVRNDHIHNNGKAMGQWWVDFSGGTAEVGDSEEGPRLILVNQRTGATTSLMELSRAYQSLASVDGRVFYAGYGADVYQIELGAQTETLLGSVAGADLRAMEFAGTTLLSFDVTGDAVVPVDTSTGEQSGSAYPVGAADLTTIVAVPRVADPRDHPLSYD